MGNRELKELICTTRGHELRGVDAGGLGERDGGGVKGENWENYNSIINKKKYLKIKTMGVRLYDSITMDDLFSSQRHWELLSLE